MWVSRSMGSRSRYVEALARHCRYGTDPEPEVVVPAPVAEVVVRAEVAPACALSVETEVRRLVPAVTRHRERVDDLLEVPLHRVRLARELVSVGEREARARLGLELVAREVLGLEGESVREVAVEVGDRLARYAVDEIERDVVEAGLAQKADGTTDVVGRGLSLENVEQMWPEALHAERHARHAVRAQERRQLRGHRLRVGLDRDLLRARKRRE